MPNLVLLIAILAQPATPVFTSQQLWDLWPDERAVTTVAPCLRHAELVASLEQLDEHFGERLRVEEVGRSFEERSIHLMTLGRGPRKVLLWSQMHGDEPSATPALLDVARYLLDHQDETGPRLILDELTLLMVPMLNPDGSEIYERRNAQGIDVNRDALNLATPEGRLLKRLRDEHAPILGFNLHDQNRRTAVGDTGELATNAVLAVAGDPEGTVTPGRRRAKRACAAIVGALAPLMPGAMARYDEDWSPRAFGDNLTSWGTPVVLIESGGLPPGRSMSELTRLNFVALLSVLGELARNDLEDHDPEIYEVLERNQRGSWVDVVVRDGSLLQPGTGRSYRSDLAFNLDRDELELAGCAVEGVTRSQIVEIGDGRFLGAGRTIDGAESLLLAPLTIGVEGWSARKWLDGALLEKLARLGVGALEWRVAPRRSKAAESIAASLRGPGRARVRLLGSADGAPALRLTAPPRVAELASFADVLRALGATPSRTGGDGLALLAELWSPRPRPDLRPGRPASFLLVAPWSVDDPDLEAARIEQVWLDGQKVRGDR